jgi:hypothetical protein
MSHAASTQPAKPINMELEESSIDSAAVDSSIAAAASAMSDLSTEGASGKGQSKHV